MRTDNIWLIVLASLVAIAAVVGAIFFTRDFNTKQSPASTVTASQLADHGGKDPFEIAEQVEVVVFFGAWNDSHRQVPVRKKIYNLISLDQQISQVIQALINGPEPEEGARTIPGDTRLLRVYMSKNGVATLVFNEAFSTRMPQGSAAELRAVYSVVNTLCVNFPSIQGVQFVIRGREDSTLAGHVDISIPLVMDESYFVRQMYPPPEEPEIIEEELDETADTEPEEGVTEIE